MRTKRQSTTKKVSKRDALLIAFRTFYGEGVIVRQAGKEFGVTDVIVIKGKMHFLTYENVTLPAASCTIPKATIATLASLETATDRANNRELCAV